MRPVSSLLLAACTCVCAQDLAKGAAPQEHWTAEEGLAVVLPPGLTDQQLAQALARYRHLKIWWCVDDLYMYTSSLALRGACLGGGWRVPHQQTGGGV